MALFEALKLDTGACIIALLTFLVSYIYFFNKDTRYRLPRGPIRLPVIGTLYLGVTPIELLLQLPSVFGSAAMFYAGSVRVVILNSYEAISEAAVTCSDRGTHRSHCTKAMNPNLKGIGQSNYHDLLRHNRSASLTILRNLGVGRRTKEEKILEEADALVNSIRERNEKAFDPGRVLTCSIANVIFSVLLNKRFSYDDPEILKIVEWIENMGISGQHAMCIDCVNWLRFIPPFRKHYLKFIAAGKGLGEYMGKYVEQHLDNYQVGDNSNFLDCWIGKSYETNQEPVLDKDNIMLILRDILVAGTETTTSSLKWTILHMANHPDIQQKVHQEIDDAIGKEKAIRLSDRDKLPYLEALVWEVQRLNTILPQALPHHTSVDTTVQEYDIPANTFIQFNLYAVHMNKKAFSDPEVFRPDRFIDANGKFFKHPEVIPFGIGKRSCLGELLARQELFLFTAALMQKFEFAPPEGVSDIDEKANLGVTCCPKRFNIRAVPR